MSAANDPGQHEALLFDVSTRTEVELRGGDRASFLHNFCTQDILGLPVGQGCEALLLNVQARILAYVRIFVRQESIWIDSEPGLGPKIVQHLDRYLVTEQVSISDSTHELTQFHLAGPRVRALLEQALGVDLSSWKPLQHGDHQLFDVRCQVRRNDYLSLPGFDLLFAATRNRTVLEGLESLGVRRADMDLFHRLRIEAGTPAYGIDIDESNLPQELNRDGRLLSYTKGCYLGQEPVVRIRDLGHVNRRLMGLKLAGCEVPAAASKVLQAGKEVGLITSAAFSPRVGSAIALAYLRRGHDQVGTLVQVDAQSAQVTSLPFVTP